MIYTQYRIIILLIYTMTGNTRGGKKYKSSKTNRVKPVRKDIELDVEGGDGYYGIVKKICGRNIIEVDLSNGTTSQARIPGRMRNKQWIKIGFKLLISRDMEVVKIIRENDKEAKDVSQMLHNTDQDNIFREQNSDDDNDISEELNKPKKNILKNRNIERSIARDNTNNYTDPSILQQESLNSDTDTNSEKHTSISQQVNTLNISSNDNNDSLNIDDI